jgi:DNA-binding MarR family transcriptional regulator
MNIIRHERTVIVASERLIENLVRLWRALHHVSARLAQHEITGQQFWLLRQLRREGSLRIGELAERLGITQSAATVACQRLERAGFVRRQRDLIDERVVYVTLTEAGVEQVEDWRRQRRELLSELVSVLDPEEQAVLEDLLERILAQAGDLAE